MLPDGSTERLAAAASEIYFAALGCMMCLKPSPLRLVSVKISRSPMTLSLPAIPRFDEDAVARALAHQNQLTKPPGSLGRLEELAVFYAGARGAFPIATPTRAFIPVFAADHGVAADNVSAFPPHLTAAILQNVVNGGAGVCVLSLVNSTSSSSPSTLG
ncbi:MAG: nicotinate-nucleotide--dimethylbenzimidazole phosphoribosyltransferase [Polyangiaceae bacterium]